MAWARGLAVTLVILLGSIGGGGSSIATASHTANQDDCSFPLTEPDQTGTAVTLTEPAREVVVLDASSAQVFWEIDAQDRVVGMPVEPYTAYLNESTTRTDVTDGQQILVELVIELDPDLVIAPNYADEQTIHTLRGAGLTVFQFPLEDSIEAIYTKTALYGHFVGECDAANARIAEMQRDIETIQRGVENRERPRVLYYFFGFTAGNDTFIHDLIILAGGDNVAATAGIEGYREISPEIVVELDPEWIVAPSHAGLPDGEPYTSTTAMRSNQTLVVDENLVSQAAPRVVEPLSAMAEAFHPDAFPPTATAPADTVQPRSTPSLVVLILVGAAVLLAAATLWFRRRPP